MVYESNIKENSRNFTIDILRVIGLLCIVLAHVSPPSIIFQLRGFDVVMMVFLSGLSFSMSSSGKNKGYLQYILMRFKRLVIPTWIFLTVYFMLFNVLGERYNWYTYLVSYGLGTGIGYMWVIRVYFLMAIIAPFCWNYLEKFGWKKYLFLNILIFSIYECVYVSITNNIVGFAIDQVVPYVIAYGIIFSIGMCIKKFNQKELGVTIVVMLMIFIILVFINDFKGVQIAKYPPHAYYIVYGVLITLVLYKVVDSYLIVSNRKIKSIFLWISQNSLWLYFWHIIPLKLIELEIIVLKYNNFIARYIVVIIVTVLITVLHNFLKLCWENKRKKYKNDQKPTLY